MSNGAETYTQAIARRCALFVARDVLASELLSQPERLGPAIVSDVGADRARSLFERPKPAITWKNWPNSTLAYIKRRRSLRRARIFDVDWYLTQNIDVLRAGVDPERHFLDHGSFEGRAPGPGFDPQGYCARYPDVVASGLEPWLHYTLYGQNEGRDPATTDRSELDLVKADRLRSVSSRASRTAGSPRLLGHLDEVGVDAVTGWICDADRPGVGCELLFYIDSQLIGLAVADHFRQDLQDLGMGDGRHGFRQSIPKRMFFEGKSLKIVIRSGASEYVFKTVTLSASSQEWLDKKRRLHIDVSDLIYYFSKHRRASGIQRVQVGLLRGLLAQGRSDYDVACCGRCSERSGFVEIPYGPLLALLDCAGDRRISDSEWQKSVRSLRKSLLQGATFARSDILFTMGAPWALDNHDEAIRAVKKRFGVLYFQTLYDIVPISMPEVVDASFIPSFTRATATLLAHADHVFPISEFSARELTMAARMLDIEAPPMSVMTLGSSMSETRASSLAASDGSSINLASLGIVGPYILCVGTIEPRKNHASLFKVWKRLLATRVSTPQLVLVGRVGWYMEDFVRMLHATNHLDGHVIIVPEASDAALEDLYRGCLFTVFPSLHEGWGLPIVESFSHGKVCLCSSTTAMPEAGGDLALYADPENIPQIHDQIVKLLDDANLRLERERLIERQFRPTSWDEAASALHHQVIAAIGDCDQRSVADPGIRGGALAPERFYRFARPGGTSTAKMHFIQSAHETVSGGVLDGPNWYDLEVDRCWSCGRHARLIIRPSLEADAPLAAILELCFLEACRGGRCRIVVDGTEVGGFSIEHLHTAVQLDLPATARASGTRSHSVTLSLDRWRLPEPSSTDNRVMGTGVMSLFLSEAPDSAAAWRGAGGSAELTGLTPDHRTKKVGVADKVSLSVQALARRAMKRSAALASRQSQCGPDAPR